MGDAAALGPAGAVAAANTLGTESHFPMERTNRPGVPRHRVLAAHSPHSPGSPRAPAAEMDLLPAALRATALWCLQQQHLAFQGSGVRGSVKALPGRAAPRPLPLKGLGKSMRSVASKLAIKPKGVNSIRLLLASSGSAFGASCRSSSSQHSFPPPHTYSPTPRGDIISCSSYKYSDTTALWESTFPVTQSTPSHSHPHLVLLGPERNTGIVQHRALMLLSLMAQTILRDSTHPLQHPTSLVTRAPKHWAGCSSSPQCSEAGMLGAPVAPLHPEMERILRRHQAALLQWNAGRVWDEQQPMHPSDG